MALLFFLIVKFEYLFDLLGLDIFNIYLYTEDIEMLQPPHITLHYTPLIVAFVYIASCQRRGNGCYGDQQYVYQS